MKTILAKLKSFCPLVLFIYGGLTGQMHSGEPLHTISPSHSLQAGSASLETNNQLNANKMSLDFQFVRETILDSQILHYFQENSRGTIIMCHSGGNNADFWITNIEAIAFVNDAVNASYSIVLLESLNRDTKLWDQTQPPEANQDIQRARLLLADLKHRGLLDEEKPIFALGDSKGGRFSSMLAFDANFDASAIYLTRGLQGVIDESTIPTIWCLAENDTRSDNTVAIAQMQSMQARNIETNLLILFASPVEPWRLARIPNIVGTQGVAIYQALKNGGFLDSNDFLLANPLESGWQSVIPQELIGLKDDIEIQLSICFSEHFFFRDFNDRVLTFFNKYAPISAIEDGPTLPSSFKLDQNYPNPFNPETKISFTLSRRSQVELQVFDIKGKVVATILNNELDAGQQEILFNGSALSSGIYFYRLKAGNRIITRKMSLLK